MSTPLMSTYARLPVTMERGDGAWLWDTQGNRYLDALGGIAVCALGHAHPAVVAAIGAQAGKLIHTSNLYDIAEQTRLAERLCRIADMDRVFFSNSGAEANEAAIKLARLAGHHRNLHEPQIIVMEGSFHGRTLATLSATGNHAIQQGFDPLVTGFVRAPYGDLDAVKHIAADNPSVTAVLVEPITGEGGIHIPPDDYLPGLRALCDTHGWLLMLDEIQCGMGRTGRWFAHQHTGIQPDVMTIAKALGNGMPIGACLAKGAAADLFQPGCHGSTFGGNPLACATAGAVIDTLDRQQLVARAATLGAAMRTQFAARLDHHPIVKAIRGRGLMIGIELTRPCGELVTEALAHGLLINVTAGCVIRLLPPYILSDEQAQTIVDGVVRLIEAFAAGNDRRNP